MIPELKPCPFCGASAKLILNNIDFDRQNSEIIGDFYIKCQGCAFYSKIFSTRVRILSNGEVKICSNGALKAANAWNRRINELEE